MNRKPLKRKVRRRKPTTPQERAAALSTGPRTDEGKAIAKLNGVRHGLNATDVVVAKLGETRVDFDRHVEGAMASFRPSNDHEAEIVAEIAEVTWLLRRVRKYLRVATEQTYANAETYAMMDHSAGNWSSNPELYQARAQLPDTPSLKKADMHRGRLIRQLKELTSILTATRRVTEMNVNILVLAMLAGQTADAQSEPEFVIDQPPQSDEKPT